MNTWTKPCYSWRWLNESRKYRMKVMWPHWLIRQQLNHFHLRPYVPLEQWVQNCHSQRSDICCNVGASAFLASMERSLYDGQFFWPCMLDRKSALVDMQSHADKAEIILRICCILCFLCYIDRFALRHMPKKYVYNQIHRSLFYLFASHPIYIIIPLLDVLLPGKLKFMLMRFSEIHFYTSPERSAFHWDPGLSGAIL